MAQYYSKANTVSGRERKKEYMQKHLQILYKSIRLKVQIKGVQNMEKLLDLAVQYDGVKTKILPNGVQFKKDKKSVSYYPSTGTVVSDENGKIKVYKRSGMELLKKELHAAFYQPVDLYKTSEYLVDIRGKWELQLLTDDTPESETCVRVPEGAVKAYRNNSGTVNFVNSDDDYMNGVTKGQWISTHRGKHETCGHVLLWQRMENPNHHGIFTGLSDLPFTTPELSEEYQALCDRVEAIDKEAARYMREEAPMMDRFIDYPSLSGSFNWEYTPHGYNYWSKLEQALLEPSSYNHIGEKQEAPSAAIGEHSHYFIDVSDVDEVDFYEIALRYNVTNPCIQHILKKCLAVGKRGHKDFAKDLQDIADTANRAVELNKQFHG